MKCNSGIVLVTPMEQQTNSFDKNRLSNYRGIVAHKADDVDFVNIGDEVLFFSVNQLIEEENWFALREEDILVNLTPNTISDDLVKSLIEKLTATEGAIVSVEQLKEIKIRLSLLSEKIKNGDYR